MRNCSSLLLLLLTILQLICNTIHQLGRPLGKSCLISFLLSLLLLLQDTIFNLVIAKRVFSFGYIVFVVYIILTVIAWVARLIIIILTSSWCLLLTRLLASIASILIFVVWRWVNNLPDTIHSCGSVGLVHLIADTGFGHWKSASILDPRLSIPDI